MSNLDEFKEFVKAHPLLKDEVASKKRTWQSIYEDYVLLDDDSLWDKYKKPPIAKAEEEEAKAEDKKSSSSTDDMIKNVMNYVKKLNPDTITKTIGSIQKVIELIGSFGAGGTAAAAASSKKMTGDPLFDRRFDEWY